MQSKTMRISKRVNRTVGKTTYYKYGITIPNSIMDELDWDETIQVKIEAKNNKILISKI